MDRKAKIIRLLEQTWQMEQEFLNEQPMEEREKPGTYEHWARKDVAGHIESWNSQLVDEIHSARRGVPPVRLEDIEAQNTKIFASHQSKTWQEAVDFASQSRQKLIDVVEELDCDGLEQDDLLPWNKGFPIWRNIIGSGFTHTIIHIAEHYRGLGQPERYASLINKLGTDIADLDDSPAWQGGILYNLACVHALNGQKDQAIDELGRALQMRPDLREWSREDSDFVSLHGDPGYERLYE